MFFLTVALFMAAACKKKTIEPEIEEPDPVDTVSKDTTIKDTVVAVPTRDELTKDSIFLYAKQVYYWYDAIPGDSIFKPRSFSKYSNPIENYDEELFKITQYKLNPSTGFPYEYVNESANYAKYSYISDITQQNPVAFVKAHKSSVDLNNNGNDFGLRLGVEGSSGNNYKLYIQAVFPNSPAEKAGLKRGDYINVVNGTTIGTNYYGGEFELFYQALFESSTVLIGGKRRDNSSFSNIRLNKASYSSTPILKDSVYTSGSKKIGYIAYARFANPATSGAAFDAIFAKFKNQGVTDLIVDLRYNGGGYVSTAEHLINLIAPSSLNGSVMFTEYYNTLMQQNWATRKNNPTAPLLARQYILDASDNKTDQNGDGKWDTYADVDFSAANQATRFVKNSSLAVNINKVAVIVTRSTASASELVINALKPHMTIKVIGEKSYGKPIGFFPIRIDKYDVYFSMFETKNSSGNGSYFDGFTPDVSADDIAFNGTNYDMWNKEDYSFKAALNFINGISSSSVLSSGGTGAKFLTTGGKDLENFEFKGMIENRIKVK